MQGGSWVNPLVRSTAASSEPQNHWLVFGKPSDVVGDDPREGPDVLGSVTYTFEQQVPLTASQQVQEKPLNPLEEVMVENHNGTSMYPSLDCICLFAA